jgi:hypothetical protein
MELETCELEERQPILRQWLIPDEDWLQPVAEHDVHGHGIGQWYDKTPVELLTPMREQHDDVELENTFRVLVEQWRRDALVLSSIPQKVNHRSYLKIIALGGNVVPLILRELRDRPTYWFAALEALTKNGPQGPFARFDDQRAAWLTWGVEHGLIAGLHQRTVRRIPETHSGQSRSDKSIRSKL